jgi:hypothetical protein
MHDSGERGAEVQLSAQIELAGLGPSLAVRKPVEIDLSNAASTAQRPRSRNRRGERPPTVLAVRSGAQLTFYCAWCRCQHWHGAHDGTRCKDAACRCPLHSPQRSMYGPCRCPPGTGNGHRHQHCTSPDSPFVHGYYLKEVSPLRLVWPGRDRASVARDVPDEVVAECLELGLDGKAARRVWQAAVAALGGAR